LPRPRGPGQNYLSLNSFIKNNKIAKIPEPVDLENLQDCFAGANTMPTPPPPESERKQGRDTARVFIEMMCPFLAVSGVNMKLTDGRAKKECLAHYNKAFEYQVESTWEAKEWVDQHGVTEDKKTPAQSIQERVHHIKTDTQETAISSIHDTITKLTRNVWLTHLHTFLDSNGHIHSDQVEEDVIEALRLHYRLIMNNSVFPPRGNATATPSI
jgi:hypothetical protein